MDRALLSFDIHADMEPAFHWNIKQLFVYVVGAMKWDQKYVKTQSSMVSALIKYGHGWDRVRNMTAADLDYAKQKLSTGAGRTLSQLFHYHYEWDEM